jgi:hypothetical protein
MNFNTEVFITKSHSKPTIVRATDLFAQLRSWSYISKIRIDVFDNNFIHCFSVYYTDNDIVPSSYRSYFITPTYTDTRLENCHIIPIFAPAYILDVPSVFDKDNLDRLMNVCFTPTPTSKSQSVYTDISKVMLQSMLQAKETLKNFDEHQASIAKLLE